MPSFRVNISRLTTPVIQSEWSQTVVAPSAEIATGYAYADWVNSRPVPPAPPLSQCRVSVRLSRSVILADVEAVSPAQTAFISAIEKKVNDTLTSKIDGDFSMVNYPSGFNYGITYGNNSYYNQATLQDINTLLGVASNGQTDLTGGGFSNLYAQVMAAIGFVYSDEDHVMMNKEDAVASAQIASILTEFENVGGKYTSPLPMGGKLQDVYNQLIATYKSIDQIPITLNALRNAIDSYESLAGNSSILRGRYTKAMARVNAAIDHVTKPSSANGGMQVGDSAYYVGFTPNKLPNTIALISGLDTSKNNINLTINLNSFNSDSSQMSISGGENFNISLASILEITSGGNASYDMSRYTSSSSSVTMNITYPGVTVFAAFPSVLSTDNSTGWYADDVLQEVVAKTGKDVTGYQLQGSEYNISDLFGAGKTFSRLKTFVISQQPTISIVFKDANSSLITSDLQVNADVRLQLFGLFNLGGASGSYAVKNVDSTTSAGSVTITFGPPQISGTIPIQQQLAYVLGGVASYPPSNA